jgi:type I restriction enzyme M protein
MLSPQLRKRIDGLWSRFWSAGISNPLIAIEQITYLLFIRELESLDKRRTDAGKPSIYASGPDKAKAAKGEYEHCRWSYIRDKASFALLNDTVFPWLRWLETGLAQGNGESAKLQDTAGRLKDAYFILDPNKTDTLTRSVKDIDELFRQLDTRSANRDIMGDIFEHLLEEVKESGKNGQFRTPRQIIRFMVELLDPRVGARIIDPACGSAGFLINTLQHWEARHTDAETLRLEWDGASQNRVPIWPDDRQPDFGASLSGLDNDRTMVRIAWMNLLLHGIEAPDVEQLDSLSKRMPDTESEGYDHVLANPPFTGSVDEDDLSENRNRVPFDGKKPRTTKSELLYVWLILDLLTKGGRAAVIVPDGVLFGPSKAHKALRRQLLFLNTLEAVVSLPPNVFQPYSGVKTSILVFQRAQEAEATLPKGDEPRTREVWFYEVADEAYSLDQKRNPRFGQDNDLFDALEKYRAWRAATALETGDEPDAVLEELARVPGWAEWVSELRDAPDLLLQRLRDLATDKTYWQPEYWQERWRVVDDAFLRLFPELERDKGKTYPIDKLWPDLPREPRDAERVVIDAQAPLIAELFERHCHDSLQLAYAEASPAMQRTLRDERDKRLERLQRAARDLTNAANKLIREEALLDREFDQFGYQALKPLLDRARDETPEHLVDDIALEAGDEAETEPELVMDQAHADERALTQARTIIRAFAKLDGYNVWCRDREVRRLAGKQGTDAKGEPARIPTLQSWVVHVRVWAKLDSWGADPETEQEIQRPTHGPDGLIDPEYLAWLKDKAEAFDDDGAVVEKHLPRLDPKCLEALDCNLSAGRHKPFDLDAGTHEPPEKLIRELDGIYAEIRARLGKLLELIEDAA